MALLGLDNVQSGEFPATFLSLHMPRVWPQATLGRHRPVGGSMSWNPGNFRNHCLWPESQSDGPMGRLVQASCGCSSHFVAAGLGVWTGSQGLM